MENMKTRYRDDSGQMRTIDFGVNKDNDVEVLRKRIKRLEREITYADDCIDRHVEEIDRLEQEVSYRDETIQELEGHIAGLEDIVCSVIYSDVDDLEECEVYNLPEGSRILSNTMSSNTINRNEVVGKALLKYFTKGYCNEVKELVSALQFSDIAFTVLDALKELDEESVKC